MVDRSESAVKFGDVKYGYHKTYEVEVSQNDTVTLDDFDSSAALNHALLWKKSDRTEVTTSTALNVVTVTGAGTNMDCILYVVGVKA